MADYLTRNNAATHHNTELDVLGVGRGCRVGGGNQGSLAVYDDTFRMKHRMLLRLRHQSARIKKDIGKSAARPVPGSELVHVTRDEIGILRRVGTATRDIQAESCLQRRHAIKPLRKVSEDCDSVIERKADQKDIG